MWSHTHTLYLSFQASLLSLQFHLYRSEIVISSIWLKAFELLCIQLNFSPLFFLKSWVIYFFFSPAVSRISQERQPHYLPKMCSSILLLCSDKGAARWVTQVHREPCRKQHFSHWSKVLHINDCQWAMGEPQSWYMQHFTCHTWQNFCVNLEDTRCFP